MCDGFFQLAYLGPGGPEFMIVMLVLLVMFGAKDAPRILRKLNEIINSVRNTADGFKREVMYGDLINDSAADNYDEDYDSDEEEDSCLGELDEESELTEEEPVEKPISEVDDARQD